MHTYTDKTDNFIIAAPTYKIMQQATLPAFLQIMEGYGEYSKGDAVFKMFNGGTCYFRTATDPDSVVGITNVRHIWGDEAGKYPLYFHENLQARASFKECPIAYTTSPYSLNWIYSDYIRPWLKNKRVLPDCHIVQARSDENPYFPKKEYERKKASMDPRRFNMIYGGQFNKLEGLVYDFDEDAHIVEPHVDLPHGTIVVAGVDWGYTNPTVIAVLAVTPNDGIYLIHEYYKTGKTIADIVQVAERLKKVYNIQRFYCDPSAPANLAEFNKKKLTAIPADNNIRAGVDAFYELIASGKFHVYRGRAKNFVDEIAMYHYPAEQDVGPDKDVKEQLPVKQNDHAMDAVRYPVYALKRTDILNKRGITLPGQTTRDLRHHAQDELLKRAVDEEYDW